MTSPSPPKAAPDEARRKQRTIAWVVGLAPGSRIDKLLRRDGVTVGGDAQGVQIGLNVVVEYGLNLAEVAATVRSQVSYEVERLTGLSVAAVEVVVQDVRQSA